MQEDEVVEKVDRWMDGWFIKHPLRNAEQDQETERRRQATR